LDPLIVYDEERIADEYKDMLYDGLFSLINDLHKPPEFFNMTQVIDKNTFVFMQDNVPCHKAVEVLKFLAKCNISIMEWPPWLPNLNPIENL